MSNVASWSRAAVFSACIDHLTRELTRVEVQLDPFPHFVLRPFFPEKIYALLLHNLPAQEHYHPFGYEKHSAQDGSSTRDRFQLTDDAIDKLDRPRSELLFGIRDALGCRALKDLVFAKLSPGLAIRYGKTAAEAQDTPGYPLPELFRERSGYTIKPHPDTRKKVVTMQIALPSDDECANLGTEFYKRSLNPRSFLREPRGFDVCKTMEFLPNTGYAFSVLNNLTLKSWHGRTKIATQTAERNTILNIWYAHAENANPDIVREHYTDRPLARAA